MTKGACFLGGFLLVIWYAAVSRGVAADDSQLLSAVRESEAPETSMVQGTFRLPMKYEWPYARSEMAPSGHRSPKHEARGYPSKSLFSKLTTKELYQYLNADSGYDIDPQYSTRTSYSEKQAAAAPFFDFDETGDDPSASDGDNPSEMDPDGDNGFNYDDGQGELYQSNLDSMEQPESTRVGEARTYSGNIRAKRPSLVGQGRGPRVRFPTSLSPADIERIRGGFESMKDNRFGSLVGGVRPPADPEKESTGGTSLSIRLDLDTISRLVAAQRKSRQNRLHATEMLERIG